MNFPFWIYWAGVLSSKTPEKVNLTTPDKVDDWAHMTFWPNLSSIVEPRVPSLIAEDLHVVITDTSRYYHNYRHAANAMMIYRIVKWLGVPDSKVGNLQFG